MPAVIPKISFPIPSNEQGQVFSDIDALLNELAKESSGQYLVGSQGMWHGGIHITDATAPWCALSAHTEAEQQYRTEPYKGAQFIRCMADGDIVAYRVDKEYSSIPWRGENLYLSTSFVLVRHTVQPGENATSGLTFYTLYMNLAPFVAYAQQGGERERKTTDRLSYYNSAEDVQTGSSAKAGTLPVGVRVTLGDRLIACDSGRGRRQFGEVTVAEEVQDAAGVTLSAGTTIWILTDRGNLKAESAASSSPPSWWAKCAPAYSTRPAGVVECKTRRGWKYYLSSEDVLQDKKEGELTADFPLCYEPGNAVQQVVRPGDSHTFSLMTLGRDVGKQKKGDRVWVVSDGDSLTPLTPTGSGEPKFGEVVLASPGVKINAGDSIGHMGFYQLPEEHGKCARYQVHIECLSMDETLPTFLTNPDNVGELTPFYLKYPEGATLFIKNAERAMVDSTRKTQAPGIITLSKVPVVEKDGQPTHYQIRPEGGYLAAADIQKLSQYALGELGFVTLDKAPESFDLIDGVKHPNNVVKGILEQMYKAAEAETRISHILNKYNYKRLLDKIDSNQDGHYSEQEYLQAIHNDSPSYRDHLYRIIARHGSEWYYGKDDPLWKKYLDTLTIDAPLWKTYTEAFIDKITWMKQVPGMGPELWHLHPVVFLGALSNKNIAIIFPLLVKPENDPGNRWGRTHNWRAAKRQNASTMDYPRSGGRIHAARDLYTVPYTPVVAICPGTVLDVRNFYNQTHQITVHHKAIDGREFIVRYGEVNPTTIKVRIGDQVIQGQQLGETGKLLSRNRDGSTRPTVQLDGTTVYMLHFELFSGAEGFNTTSPLTDVDESPYMRRGDLLEPVQLLIEGYDNTFNIQTNQSDRKDVNTLMISEEGKQFIKGWEDLRLVAYNDSRRYCTIGYGHLIEKAECQNITLPDEFKNGIDQEKASQIFNSDIVKFERAVKSAVSVKLYQYEFDALVSLLFNCGENFFALNKAPSLIRNLNDEKYELAANEFSDITNGGEEGLVKRRRAEKNIFLNNVYDSTH